MLDIRFRKFLRLHTLDLFTGPCRPAQSSWQWPHRVPLCEPTQWFHPVPLLVGTLLPITFPLQLHNRLCGIPKSPNLWKSSLSFLSFVSLGQTHLVAKLTRQGVSIYTLHEWGGVYILWRP